MDVLQFYPTPFSLAQRAVKRFREPIACLLEPSAGRGDLLEPLMESHHYGLDVDCIEFDLDNCAILRKKELSVIDHDFLDFRNGAMYSHILMNPPFNQGADHVLHAWEILDDGEIVAILNAETLRNPCNAKRCLLSALVQDHGTVEYVQSAFLDPDTQRKTEVDVAIIHLVKKTDLKQNYVDAWSDLTRDPGPGFNAPDTGQALALPQSTIENLVRCFDAAVDATREEADAAARAHYYRSLMDSPLSKRTPDVEARFKHPAEYFNEKYREMKKSAWQAVFCATDFSRHISRKVLHDLQRNLEDIAKMEFTVKNIYGLLSGLVAKKADIQIDMLCEVFDEFARYHTDNRAYYRGWKSNDKHRSDCYRLKTTRIILPTRTPDWYNALEYETKNLLNDIDKVFALLDGKAECAYGLGKLIEEHYKTLIRDRVRMSSDYFDVRCYGGAQTIHLFPRRKDLIDRLNRLVGRQRAWLPDDEHASDPGFWEQYNRAEEVTAEMLKGIKGNWSREQDVHQRPERRYDRHADACQSLGIPLPMLDAPDTTPALTGQDSEAA